MSDGRLTKGLAGGSAILSVANSECLVFSKVIYLAVFHTVFGADESNNGNDKVYTPMPTTTTKKPVEFIEQDVLGFRLWMILGFVFAAMLLIIVILCCVFDCRIPRTKQEIEADQERREYKKRMKQGLPQHTARAQPRPARPGPARGGPAQARQMPRVRGGPSTGASTLPGAANTRADAQARPNGTRTMEATGKTLASFQRQ